MACRGSVEATKYAQLLIEALINDTDKKFEQQLPKMKPLQPASTSHGTQKQKLASNQRSNGLAGSAPKENQLPKSAATKAGVGSGCFAVGAWQQTPSSAVKGNSAPVAPATVASAWSTDSTAVRASPDIGKISYSDRAKGVITVSSYNDHAKNAVMPSSAESSYVSRSPPLDKMKILLPATSSSISGGSGGVVFSATSLPQRCEPQPLPIVTATSFASPTALSRLSATMASVMRDYSPFNNALSQIIAESVLTKRTDDFASVAAAGVVTSSPPLSVSYADDATAPVPLPAAVSDPHKAPGYKAVAASDPTKAPGHRASKDVASSLRAQAPSSTATDAGYRPVDYGRPNSTPNAAVNLSVAADNPELVCSNNVGLGGPDNPGLVGQALAASLDRPASFYANTAFCPSVGYPVPPPPPPGLVQMGPAPAGDVSQLHQFGAARNCVTETSVLAAPLMATSLSSVSHADSTGHHFSLAPPVTATAASAGNQFIVLS